MQTCRALGYAHRRGVIHGDPKPANVLVTEAGHALVIDWEFAQLAKADEGQRGVELEEAAEAGRAAGTPAYMAPELFSGGAVSRATDVYALGATLYHLLTGQAPNPERVGLLEEPDQLRECLGREGPLSPRRAGAAVAEALDAACARATALAPSARHAGADELGDEVQRWLDARR